MKISSIVVIVCCAFMGPTGLVMGHPRSGRPKRDTVEKFIQYITDGGIVTAQKVVVTDTEAEFQIQGGMHAVFDYEQLRMTLRRSPSETVCFVAPYSPVISLDEIKDLLEQDKFEYPSNKKQVSLQKADDQTPPELSPLSQTVCEGAEVVVMEPKPVPQSAAMAITDRPKSRPKREVGWGEVLLIVVVVIILL